MIRANSYTRDWNGGGRTVPALLVASEILGENRFKILIFYMKSIKFVYFRKTIL